VPVSRASLTLAAILAALAVVPALADSPPFYVSTWGTLGTAPGQFDHCGGIATDGQGHVYVTDQHNYRVEAFDLHGNYILEFPTGDISFPTGITLGPNYVVYTVMNHTHVVAMNANTGAPLGQFGVPGAELFYPVGVATDAAGNVYIADYGNVRVDKYTAAGVYLFSWGTSGGPYGITVDNAGAVYVAEWGTNRVEKFTSTGAFITFWGTSGTGPGQFDGPEGMDVDPSGNVYVVDTGNHRVQKFTSSGAFLTLWGGLGTGPGQMYSPNGVAIDEFGDIYVDEWNGSRVQKFSYNMPTPTAMTTWGRLKAAYR
jgi:sugar lactone lactonase YvrE